jgi:hypothetical protein
VRISVVEGDRSITLQVGEKYRHFKGGLYTIVGFAAHTETYDMLVIYTDSRGYHWARPAGMFIDTVPLHSNSDQLVPRFEKVGDRIEERHVCTEGWTGCSNPVVLERMRKLEAIVQAVRQAKRRYEKEDTGTGFVRPEVAWAMYQDLDEALTILEETSKGRVRKPATNGPPLVFRGGE